MCTTHFSTVRTVAVIRNVSLTQGTDPMNLSLPHVLALYLREPSSQSLAFLSLSFFFSEAHFGSWFRITSILCFISNWKRPFAEAYPELTVKSEPDSATHTSESEDEGQQYHYHYPLVCNRKLQS